MRRCIGASREGGGVVVLIRNKFYRLELTG